MTISRRRMKHQKQNKTIISTHQENENDGEDDYQPAPQETSETEQNNHINPQENENDGEGDCHPTPKEMSETEQNNHTNPQENEENEKKKTGKQKK